MGKKTETGEQETENMQSNSEEKEANREIQETDQGREKDNHREKDLGHTMITEEVDHQKDEEKAKVIEGTVAGEMKARKANQISVFYSQTNIILVLKMHQPEKTLGPTPLEWLKTINGIQLQQGLTVASIACPM